MGGRVVLGAQSPRLVPPSGRPLAVARSWCRLLCALLLAACQSKPESPPAAPTSAAPPAPASAPPQALASAAPASAAPARLAPDWKAWLAAEATCADCHPDEVAAWKASPMGRSMATAHALPPGLPVEVPHPLTSEKFKAQAKATAQGPVLEQSVHVDGVDFARESAFVVGSGAHTQSWFWREGTALFQQPLTWYSQAQKWDLSPGYAPAGHPGFFREVTDECTWCHGALLNAPNDPLPADTADRGIPCARCHGDPRPHIQARQAGKDAPITVPTKLAPEREAAVCEYCHLQGTVRLLAEGRGWTDFVPGMALGDVVAIFDRAGPRTSVGIVSHSARLRESKCRAPGEERLTCTACHQPHALQKRDRSAPCRDCHMAEKATHCKGANTDDCVACHMSRVGTSDIPHVSITDHLIAKIPAPLPPVPPGTKAPLIQVGDLAQPTPDAPGDVLRRYGRAYAEAARTSGDPQDIASGYDLLRAGINKATGPIAPENWFDLASLELFRGDWTAARAAIEQAFAGGDTRPRVLASLASLRLRQGDLKAALEVLERAPPEAEDYFPYLTNKGAVLAAAGQKDAARAASDKAITARPLDAEAWVLRGTLAQVGGDLKAAAEAFTTATRRRPDDLRAWLDLGQVHLKQRDFAAALNTFGEVLKRTQDPTVRANAQAGQARAHVGAGNLEAAAALLPEVFKAEPVPDAYVALAALALAAGRVEEAGKAIDAAVPHLQDDAELWWIAAAILEKRGMVGESVQARERAIKLGHPGK